MKKTKRKAGFDTKQLLAFGIIFAAAGIVALTLTSAKGSSVLVFGGSSCQGGVWMVDGKITSQVASTVIRADIYSSDNTSGYQLIRANVPLPYQTVYSFQYSPSAGERKGKIVLTPVGANPATASSVGSARVTNPCN